MTTFPTADAAQVSKVQSLLVSVQIPMLAIATAAMTLVVWLSALGLLGQPGTPASGRAVSAARAVSAPAIVRVELPPVSIVGRRELATVADRGNLSR